MVARRLTDQRFNKGTGTFIMGSHIAFLGFCQTDEDFDAILLRDSAMPVQTQRFGWSVVSAIESAGGEVSILAAAPASDWPGNKALFFGGTRSGRRSDGAPRTHQLLGFVNIIGLKHLTRYLSAVRGLRRIVRTEPITAILVHGVHSPFLHAAVRVGRASGIPVVPILTDAPSDPALSGRAMVRALRRLDLQLISTALEQADGVIALTEGLARDYAPGRPFLLLVGIAPTIAPAGDSPDTAPRRVVYAGGLSATYGVDMLLDAVEASHGDWILEVFGKGELEDDVRDAERRDPRVVYGGVVPPAELSEIYARADLLVNPRPPEQELVRYSFPSKLLEYMAVGRPVLSTRLPTIPAEFDTYLLYTEADPGSIAANIDEFMARTPTSRSELGRSCREFAIDRYGPKAQGKNMMRFMSELSADRRPTHDERRER